MRCFGFGLALVLMAPAYARAQMTPTVRPEVIQNFPHDADAFTQGLLLHEGEFYESTGLLGRSSVRRVDPGSGTVLQQLDLPNAEFGEGLALVGEQLIQLTWQNNIAHVYNRETFADAGSFNYDGEGWGLCYDGARLVMSDGSSSLFFRDADTFALQGEQVVLLDGEPIDQLNELECVGSLVYANVWQTNAILRIDPTTGRVLTVIDAANLLEPAEENTADVLNGIAFDPGSDHFFITGKLWPRVFEVAFPFESGFEPDGVGGNNGNAGNGGSTGGGGAATGGTTVGGAGGNTTETAGGTPAVGGSITAGGAVGVGGTASNLGGSAGSDSAGSSDTGGGGSPGGGNSGGAGNATSAAGDNTDSDSTASEEPEPLTPSAPPRDASVAMPAEADDATSSSCACKVSKRDSAGVTQIFAVFLGLLALFSARRPRRSRMHG